MEITVYDQGKFFTFSETDKRVIGVAEYFSLLDPQTLDETWEDCLKRRGFECQSILKTGIEIERSLTIYSGRKGRYLALIEVGNTLEEILIEKMSSLLKFLKEFEGLFRVQKDYIETESRAILRKDCIKEMQVYGSYKKDELCKLIAYDKNDNPTVICEARREYINQRLAEEFSIER